MRRITIFMSIAIVGLMLAISVVGGVDALGSGDSSRDTPLSLNKNDKDKDKNEKGSGGGSAGNPGNGNGGGAAADQGNGNANAGGQGNGNGGGAPADQGSGNGGNPATNGNGAENAANSGNGNGGGNGNGNSGNAPSAAESGDQPSNAGNGNQGGQTGDEQSASGQEDEKKKEKSEKADDGDDASEDKPKKSKKKTAKVRVCHVTGMDDYPYNLIEISSKALEAHEDHGDFIAPDGAYSSNDCGDVATAGTPVAFPDAEEPVASPQAISVESDSVRVCHVTSSEKNPFILIEINDDALEAHEAHGDFEAPENANSSNDCEAAAPVPAASPVAFPVASPQAEAVG